MSERLAIGAVAVLAAAVAIKKGSRARTKGKSLPETGYTLSVVSIYRAVPAGVTTIEPMDYVTRTKKWAQGHADHVAAVEEEEAVVLKAMVKAADVYEASNPGEYFYDGPAVRGRVVYRHGKGSSNTPFRFSGDICPHVPEDVVNWSSGDWWHPVPVEQIEWSEFRAAVELVPDDVSASGFLGWELGWEPFEQFVGGDDGWRTEPGGGTHGWFRGTLPSGQPFFVWQGSGIEHWWTPGGVGIDGEREQAIITELEPKLDAIAQDRDVSVADTLRLLDLGGEP